MKVELVLSIVGVFLVMGLSINAFFLKGIYSDLNFVKIRLAEMFTRSEAKERRLEKLEENEKELYNRINEAEKKLISLEV